MVRGGDAARPSSSQKPSIPPVLSKKLNRKNLLKASESSATKKKIDLGSRNGEKKLALLDWKEVNKKQSGDRQQKGPRDQGQTLRSEESDDVMREAPAQDDVMGESQARAQDDVSRVTRGTEINDALNRTYDLVHEDQTTREEQNVEMMEADEPTAEPPARTEASSPKAQKQPTPIEAEKPKKAINWTLSDEILADIACQYCHGKGCLRKKGQYRIDPIRGPAVRCNTCTRTYQGSSVMSLLQASAYSPTVYNAMRMAERWIEENKKALNRSGSRDQEPDWIQHAVKQHKAELTCPTCKRKDTFRLQGHAQNRRVIRCGSCGKIQSGDNAENVVTSALGADWKSKAKLNEPRSRKCISSAVARTAKISVPLGTGGGKERIPSPRTTTGRPMTTPLNRKRSDSAAASPTMGKYALLAPDDGNVEDTHARIDTGRHQPNRADKDSETTDEDPIMSTDLATADPPLYTGVERKRSRCPGTHGTHWSHRFQTSKKQCSHFKPRMTLSQSRLKTRLRKSTASQTKRIERKYTYLPEHNRRMHGQS